MPLLALIMVATCSRLCHPASPAPQQTFDLVKILPGAVIQDSSVSIEFLTDKTLALCLHLKNSSCKIYLVEWSGDDLHTFSNSSGVETLSRFIHRVGDAHILSTGLVYSQSVLYSEDLQQKEKIPFVFFFLMSASGKVAATSALTKWTVYELVPAVRTVREGSGQLLSVSDDAIVVRRDNRIYTETLDGKELGSFSVKPSKNCFNAKILDNHAMFVNECNRQYIADFKGNRLANTRQPEGNPLRTEMDDSGSRLLFDHATRHVSIFKSAGEVAQTVASMGVGAPDQEDNGEAVRVIDTKTGRTCFDWHTDLLPELAHDSHSDISPSGRFIAIVHGATLSFYRLSDDCSAP